MTIIFLMCCGLARWTLAATATNDWSDCHSQAASDWSNVLEDSTMSSRSLMLQPSLADVSKFAPFRQLGQACKKTNLSG
jgi:hypothetical protein